jgi:hypothetical protein
MSKQPPKKPAVDNDRLTSAPTLGTSVAAALPEGDPTQGVPAPDDLATRLIEQVQALNDADLNEALTVIRAEVRRRENERAALRPRTGSKVRILKGRPKYVGKVGTAIIVRRSRCFVSVPEIPSPAYVLIADLELVER